MGSSLIVHAVSGRRSVGSYTCLGALMMRRSTEKGRSYARLESETLLLIGRGLIEFSPMLLIPDLLSPRWSE